MVLTNVAQNSFDMQIKDDESCLFVHAVPKSDKTLLDVPTSTDGQNAVLVFALMCIFSTIVNQEPVVPRFTTLGIVYLRLYRVF